MTVARPRTLDATLHALAELPDAHLLAGGTDFMVEVNFGHRRPRHIVGLRRVAELQGWEAVDGHYDLGAGLTYTALQYELADGLPGLAAAARTVGSPQIRNAGTVGGNVGTASPAGDLLPLLVAMDAEVVTASRHGARTLPVAEFITGPKRTGIRGEEVIHRVRVPRIAGPQQFLKVGTRNAMVISVACLGLVLDPGVRRVGVGLGSVGPRPLRAPDAEAYLSETLDWDRLRAADDDVERFGQLVAQAATPITDHRSTAAYRRHAVGVLARRALRRSLA